MSVDNNEVIEDLNNIIEKIVSEKRKISKKKSTQIKSTCLNSLTSINTELKKVKKKLASGQTKEEKDEEKVGFSTFLSEMSEAAIEAQKNLDVASKEYLDSITGKNHILPTIFRIPKLTADIKFAMERKGTEKVNLIFYSKGKDEIERNQQSLQFDIIATPPTPEVIQKLNKVRQIELVLSPQLRKEIFKIVKDNLDKLDGEDKVKLKNLEDLLKKQEMKRRFIICPTGHENCFFLLYAEKSGVHRISLWHLNMNVIEQKKVLTVVCVLNSVEDSFEPLKNYILEQAEQQANFLKQI